MRVSAASHRTAPAFAPRAVAPEPAESRDVRTIRLLIWAYLILWLIEGGLRRWVLPGLASPLLLIRDPVVLATYYFAVRGKIFPNNGFILWGAFLAALSFLNAMVLGHGNVLVALYGVRCDFLHIPLIFIMAKVLRKQDLLTLAKTAAWIAVPYSALMVAQFYEPQTAWVNRGVGGNMEGAGFSGALDHFRPPGTFSFTTGPTALYPLFTACWFALLLARRLPLTQMILAGGAILIAIPISISRALFLEAALVVVAGLAGLLLGGRLSPKLVLQFSVAVVAIGLVAGQFEAFQDGMEAFSSRWSMSTTEEGGVQASIVDRVFKDLFGAFGEAQSSGEGTGYSTNVGQQLLTRHVGFGDAEAEWGRILFDNGIVLGTLMIGYRVILAWTIGFGSVRALRRRSTLGIVFAAACFMGVLTGEWGQTTNLGAAVIGAGITLALLKPEVSAGQGARFS